MFLLNGLCIILPQNMYVCSTYACSGTCCSTTLCLKKCPTFTTCYNFYIYSSIATIFGI